MLASNYPILDIFLTTLYFFIFIIWLWLLFMVFIDIFRSHDLTGWAKALWVIGIIVMPYLGVLVYLIFRGGKMHERAAATGRPAAEGLRPVRQAGRRGAGQLHRRPARRSWPSQVARACSPMPNSRRRRPRSWPAERGRDRKQHNEGSTIEEHPTEEQRGDEETR